MYTHIGESVLLAQHVCSTLIMETLKLL